MTLSDGDQRRGEIIPLKGNANPLPQLRIGLISAYWILRKAVYQSTKQTTALHLPIKPPRSLNTRKIKHVDHRTVLRLSVVKLSSKIDNRKTVPTLLVVKQIPGLFYDRFTTVFIHCLVINC